MGFLAPVFAAAGTALASVGTAVGASAATATAVGATVVSTVASTGLAVAGSLASGAANQQMALYQARVAENNAKISEQNADVARAAGQEAESATRWKTGQLVAAQMADQAANGIDVGVGTPVQVREGTSALGEADAMRVRYNAARAAYGYQVDQASLTADAGMDRLTASNAKTRGILGAGTSMLSGASSITNNRLRLSEVGAIGSSPKASSWTGSFSDYEGH